MNLLTLPPDLAANGMGIDNAKFMELGQKFDARLKYGKGLASEYGFLIWPLKSNKTAPGTQSIFVVVCQLISAY